ncbi:MAG TPA: DNA mismatch endonuclease Vsr [Phycisphaerales bacterium]|nr:DNA mismatch endonuclease Vsr [Phycisphaerales bacterium]
MDVHTKEQRSFNMSRIRDKNTRPEMLVRSLTHHMGYRYRLHQKNLPGKPDLVFKRHKKVIFVHGCFWHMHNCRYGKVTPKTNRKFWQTKREGNVTRDKANIRKLRRLGWKVLTVWECQTRNEEKLTKKLDKFLSS